MHALCIAVAVTCLFPLVWMVSSSLKTQSTVFTDMSLIPTLPQWKNYYIAWTRAHFGLYFFNSVFYTICIVSGVVLVSSLAAFAFSRLKFPGKDILFYMFLITMMIPIPGAFIPLYAMLKKYGLIDTRIGYILPQINYGLAFAIYILKTFFDEIPKDLEDSARIDGCGRFKIYFHIALPLAKSAIAVIVIFNTLNAWNEFFFANLILNTQSKMPLQRGLMVFQGAHFTDYPLLMAGITISVLPIVLVYLLMQRHIIKGITAGAVKG